MKRTWRGVISLIMSLALLLSVCIAVPAYAADPISQIKESSDIKNKKQRSITEVNNADDVILVAHRGLGTEAPENTLPAYELAAKKGFKYAETDIQATKDGVWVASHDSNLKRMTGYDGEIADMTLAEVQSHPITNGANVDKYPGLVTPTFDDFIRTCKENDLNPVVEIKCYGLDKPYQAILDTLNKYDMKDRTIIISFYTQPLASVRALDPDVHMQYLSNTMSTRVILNAKLLQNCGIDVLQYGLLAAPLTSNAAHLAGVEMNAWTVDDPTIASLLVFVDKPEYITTNTLMPAQN